MCIVTHRQHLRYFIEAPVTTTETLKIHHKLRIECAAGVRISHTIYLTLCPTPDFITSIGTISGKRRSDMSSNSRARASPASPALMPAVGFPKRHKYSNNKGNFRRHQVLFRWLRRPSAFLVVTFCLLVTPPLWFVSRTAVPVPAFVAELEGGRTKLLRASSRKQVPSIEAGIPPVPARHQEPEEGVRVPSERVGHEAPTPLRASEEKNTGRMEWRRATLSPWKPPVLPAEVFRDVPEEECIPSPLLRKKVNPSDYEFGCEEIYVSLLS